MMNNDWFMDYASHLVRLIALEQEWLEIRYWHLFDEQECRGWITKNGRHILIGEDSGGGGKSRKSVDKSGGSGIINIASNAHSRDTELEELIKKCIFQEKPVFADDLARCFSKIPPEKGRFILSLHGNSDETFIYGRKINAKILANIIRSRNDYNGKDEIVLIACHTGSENGSKPCFAQQLANEINRIVHAPTKYGAISIFGNYYSSDSKGIKDGEMKEFKPEVKK